MNFLKLDEILAMPLPELMAKADAVRKKSIGNRLDLCGIINAKCGACSENCKFCAQSAHYSSNITAYSLKSDEEILASAHTAKKNGARNFGIVTSGNRLNVEEIGRIAHTIQRIIREVGIIPCASLGALGDEAFKVLKAAGLVRYHHNIETSRRYYSEIVTTHNYDERISTIKSAKNAGLEVCSGGILGMGETWQDRMDMAMLLKELNVDSVPINFLVPIKGTPLGNSQKMSPTDALRAIALFRLVLEDKVIKVAAGRESVLKDFQGMMYQAGANGMMVGGYLTIAGRAAEEDQALVAEIQKLWTM